MAHLHNGDQQHEKPDGILRVTYKLDDVRRVYDSVEWKRFYKNCHDMRVKMAAHPEDTTLSPSQFNRDVPYASSIPVLDDEETGNVIVSYVYGRNVGAVDVEKRETIAYRLMKKRISCMRADLVLRDQASYVRVSDEKKLEWIERYGEFLPSDASLVDVYETDMLYAPPSLIRSRLVFPTTPGRCVVFAWGDILDKECFRRYCDSLERGLMGMVSDISTKLDFGTPLTEDEARVYAVLYTNMRTDTPTREVHLDSTPVCIRDRVQEGHKVHLLNPMRRFVAAFVHQTKMDTATLFSRLA